MALGLTIGLFVFGKNSVLSNTASLIRDLSLEQSMPTEEKARSGSSLCFHFQRISLIESLS